MTSDATYHAHWQQSQELHARGASAPAEIESDLSERYSILAAQLDHLLAALSIEKSKTIPEIRDMYGLDEGERP